MPAAKRRRLYFTVAWLLCLVYSFHVSFRSIIQIDTASCSNSILQQNGVSLAIRSFRQGKKFQAASTSGKNAAAKKRDLTQLSRTDYFGCYDFDKLPQTVQSRKENRIGNRGISFITVEIDGWTIPAVYKEAHRILKTASETYKYYMAIREIEYLQRLQGLPGIPKLFGSCIKSSSVTYLVERIMGLTFCNDNGTTVSCSDGKYITEKVNKTTDPKLAALNITHSTARLFRIFEERHLFFEDISGVNLMMTPEFDVYLIDADSLVFYNESRLFSKLMCKKDLDCSGPSGNLWVPLSLNARIYKKCKDLNGICENDRCRGVDVALHACGLAEWFICKLVPFFKDEPRLHRIFKSICTCMIQPQPKDRCNFAFVEKKLKKMINIYQQS